MSFKKRMSVFFSGLLLLGLSFTAVAFSYPYSAVCALYDTTSRHTNKQSHYSQLIDEAKTRIFQKFGSMKSNPRIVFHEDSDEFWPFKVNTYGATGFFGKNNLCVFIGPNGRNVDVIAHELLHAELFDRVGTWQSLTEIPVWFNEGIAMQVDLRQAYILEPNDVDTRYVIELDKSREFYVSNDDQLTLNYSAAKVEVKKLLNVIGDDRLFNILDQIGSGKEFPEAIAGIY